MVKSDRPPRNVVVKYLRMLYNPIGFSKGYNFILFFITCGGLLGFSLAKLPLIDINGVFCNDDHELAGAPGECYYYSQDFYKLGMMIHLCGILPAGILACLQFVPVIRHKVILFHRINGYVTLTLTLVGMAGAIMITPISFGGKTEVVTGLVVMAILFIGALIMAMINIKRLQIEQHRAWMIRAWVYAGSIVTLRVIQIIAVIILSKGQHYLAMPCGKILYVMGGNARRALRSYPECAPALGANATTSGDEVFALVRARWAGATGPEQAGAAFALGFGIGLWLALFIHLLLAELYLQLTPAETERLRQFSYQRQLKARMRNPGSAGLTSDRLGDAEKWEPKGEASQRESSYRLVPPEERGMMDTSYTGPDGAKLHATSSTTAATP